MSLVNLTQGLAISIELEKPLLDVDITLVFQLGIFILLMLFLNKYVLKPYLRAYDARESQTTGAVEEAQKLKELSAASQEEYKTRRQEVFACVETERKRQISDAQAEQSSRLDEKRAQVAYKINQRQLEFDAEMAQARMDSDKQVALISAEITRKLLA